MFNKLNFYTLATFVVYPVFFIGTIVLFLFVYNKKDDVRLVKKNDSVRNERPEPPPDVVPRGTIGIIDSLSYTVDELHS